MFSVTLGTWVRVQHRVGYVTSSTLGSSSASRVVRVQCHIGCLGTCSASHWVRVQHRTGYVFSVAFGTYSASYSTRVALGTCSAWLWVRVHRHTGKCSTTRYIHDMIVQLLAGYVFSMTPGALFSVRLNMCSASHWIRCLLGTLFLHTK